MTRPPDDLKQLCDGLASAATTLDGARLIRQLHLAGLFGRRPDQAAAPAAGRQAGDPDGQPASQTRVGVWERKGGDAGSVFVRRMDLAAEWGYWANVGRIEPRGARRRIVLLGESAARGYLYDPEYTPALVLSGMLASHWGRDEVEVVDLARTNLGFELRELAAAALLLAPDAVVIFAGNNWRISTGTADLPRLGPLLREEGVPGLKRLAEQRLAANVRRLVTDVATAYAATGVPLLWLVPESNLDDWRDPSTQAPHLAAGANRRWLELWQAARRARCTGDLAAAADLAERMIELDGGVSATGFHLLADGARRRGDLQAARRFLELARGAAIWDGSQVVSPRPYSVAQETLRHEAARHRHHLVDLPRVFADYLDGGLPGRRLFLDYCHLTAEGIQVAMAAAAAGVLRAVSAVDVPWRRLVDRGLAPSLDTEAGAAFLAAVHNAHWWQRHEVVLHHCRRAVRADPEIAQVMTRFIDIQIRRTPMDMGRPAEELAEIGSPLIRHYLLRFNNQQLDTLLIAALVTALAEVGVDAAAAARQALRDERSLRHGAANLLEFYYGSAAVQPQEVMWVMPRGPKEASPLAFADYYKAYAPESAFVFVGEAGRPARLRLTCRLPAAEPAAGKIAVALNGSPLVEEVLTRAWTAIEIPVAGQRVIEGANQVSIRWPTPELAGEAALAAVVDDLIDEVAPDLYPVFGEIHSFTAEDAPDLAADLLSRPLPGRDCRRSPAPGAGG